MGLASHDSGLVLVSPDLTLGVTLPDLLWVGLESTDVRLHQLLGEGLLYGTMVILGTSLGVGTLVRGSNVVILSVSQSIVALSLCFTTLHATGV